MYRTTADIRGRWLDFKFRIRFSRTPGGLVQGWLGDERILQYTGINAYPGGLGS
jgi:hypothetical protein